MEQTLVTVGVVTYNSGKFILETLDSVYHQTYKNIQLIISDDNSSDNTVEKIREWVDIHKGRFQSVHLVTSDVNTGTSGNGNRAIFRANGEWYKSLDGDDILTPTAIQDYMNFVNSHKGVDFVFGRIAIFRNDFDKNKLEYHEPAFYNYLYRENVTAKQQFNVLTKHFAASGSSGFYRLNVLKDKMGGYDERFPLMEDYPLLIKLTKKGHRLWLLDKVTLYYRISLNSITNSMDDNRQILSNSDIRQLIDYKYEYLKEHYGFWWRLFLGYTCFMKRQILLYGNSKRNVACKIINIILYFTNPYAWHGRVLKVYYRLLNYSV